MSFLRVSSDSVIKLSILLLSGFAIGSLVYGIFNHEHTTHAQAKVSVDLGTETVEAYANIEVQLPQCEAPEPEDEWNWPWKNWEWNWKPNIQLPEIHLPEIHAPEIPEKELDIKARLSMIWQKFAQFTCKAFSMVLCPLANVLLWIRNLFLSLFSGLHYLVCQLITGCYLALLKMSEVMRCHVILEKEDQCESQFMYRHYINLCPGTFNFTTQTGSDLFELLLNLTLSCLVATLFLFSERLLDCFDFLSEVIDIAEDEWKKGEAERKENEEKQKEEEMLEMEKTE